MNTPGQNDGFALRFYSFARHQFGDELQNDFPRLRSIKGTKALFVIDVFQALGKEERRHLMESCLRRAHGQACALLNENLSETQRERLKSFDELRLATSGQWKYVSLKSKRGYRTLFRSQNRPLPPEATDADFLDDAPAKIDRKIFFRELKARIAGSFGEKPTNCGVGEWLLWASIGECSVALDLDFGGQSAQLRYTQKIRSELFGDFSELSIGHWLGVGELAWDLCTVNDSASVAASVADLANEFVVNVPEFLGS